MHSVLGFQSSPTTNTKGNGLPHVKTTADRGFFPPFLKGTLPKDGLGSQTIPYSLFNYLAFALDLAKH